MVTLYRPILFVLTVSLLTQTGCALLSTFGLAQDPVSAKLYKQQLERAQLAGDAEALKDTKRFEKSDLRSTRSETDAYPARCVSRYVNALLTERQGKDNVKARIDSLKTSRIPERRHPALIESIRVSQASRNFGAYAQCARTCQTAIRRRPKHKALSEKYMKKCAETGKARKEGLQIAKLTKALSAFKAAKGLNLYYRLAEYNGQLKSTKKKLPESKQVQQLEVEGAAFKKQHQVDITRVVQFMRRADVRRNRLQRQAVAAQISSLNADIKLWQSYSDKVRALRQQRQVQQIQLRQLDRMFLSMAKRAGI